MVEKLLLHKPLLEEKKKAGASHLLSPTMSDSEIGGGPAISSFIRFEVVVYMPSQPRYSTEVDPNIKIPPQAL